MKITSCYPIIVTSDPQPTIDAYCSIGFEVAHVKENASSAGSTSTIMKSECGDTLVISSAPGVPSAMVMVHINVDDLKEAIEHLKGLGYRLISKEGDKNETALVAAMVAPDGHCIQITEHIK